MKRMMTLILAMVGLYPQYRAVRTILIGVGVVGGDWQDDHANNKKNLYIIEPVVESLLQVTQISEAPVAL